MLNKRYKMAAAVCMISLTSLMVTACGKQNTDSILSGELVKADSKDIGSNKVEKGSFVQSTQQTGEKLYPKQDSLTFAYDGVTLEEIVVKAHDVVKKGDLIAKASAASEEAIQEQKDTIESYKKTSSQSKSSYEAQISKAQNEINSLSGYDKQIKEKELEKLKIEYNQLLKDIESSLADMNSNLEAMSSAEGDMNLYAPYDGVISVVQKIPEGTILSKDREIVTMYADDTILFKVKDDGTFRYNMEVTIEYGSGDDRKTIKGRVVSCNNVLPDDLDTGYAYIRADEQLSSSELKNIAVIADRINIGNVLTVPITAVSKTQSGSFVAIVEGEKTKYSPVVTAYETTESAWILQGIREGDAIAIQ